MITSEELRKSFGYLFENELPFLKYLVQSLPPNPVVVNIGAGAGTSGLAILECRPDSYLYTIDITKENSPLGCLYAEEQVLREAQLWDIGRNKQFQQDSKVAALWWYNMVKAAHRTIDMIFIDGDHTYYGAYMDIKWWSRHVKQDGIIAIHDYDKQKVSSFIDGPNMRPWKGVDRAVDNIMLGNRDLEKINIVESLIAIRVKNKIENIIHRQDRSMVDLIGIDWVCLRCGEVVELSNDEQCEIA